MLSTSYLCFVCFTDPPTTEIYTLSLHDALPISPGAVFGGKPQDQRNLDHVARDGTVRERKHRRIPAVLPVRSEEHTSELQSRVDLVCRLLLEKKKKKQNNRRQHVREPTMIITCK